MVLENEILGETALNSKLKFIRKREQNWVFIVNVEINLMNFIELFKTSLVSLLFSDLCLRFSSNLEYLRSWKNVKSEAWQQC